VNSADDSPDVRLPVSGLKSVRALDFDPVDLVIYWIENQSNTIRRARDTSTHVRTDTMSGKPENVGGGI